MNKEFIPYEQALALKELGFDESCVMYWRPEMDGSMHLWHHDDAYFWDATGSNNSDNAKWVTCTAPLYQQAFKWFRDNHGLVGLTTTFNSKNNFRYAIYAEYIGTEDYKTYEEAESACLDKLIEIVKNKYYDAYSKTNN